jgi:hypothetical protein
MIISPGAASQTRPSISIVILSVIQLSRSAPVGRMSRTFRRASPVLLAARTGPFYKLRFRGRRSSRARPDSDQAAGLGCHALAVLDQVLEFVSVVLEEALHRHRRGIAQGADGAPADPPGDAVEQIQIPGRPLPSRMRAAPAPASRSPRGRACTGRRTRACRSATGCAGPSPCRSPRRSRSRRPSPAWSRPWRWSRSPCRLHHDVAGHHRDRRAAGDHGLERPPSFIPPASSSSSRKGVPREPRSCPGERHAR